ncbi:1-acyl-sn-glycerol-3-phosphate acyltransferase [Lachnospiraceae bacterium PF1-22]|uniref:lysophospholipid acyltransferase family protein n=1 Tax=Ohessyouella blattaphilus TaxID=2949333 RepID=UPI003E239716
MKRIILMVFKNILILPYIWIKLCYYASHVDKYTEEQRYNYLDYIVKHANRGGNVTIAAFGQENIPKKSGFMFYPNHQGLYDVLAILEACPTPFSVVAKKEVENIPLLKQTFKCMQAFMIDRDNPRQGLEVILNVVKEVKKGRNYLIFAEGTRSKEGNKVQDFKGGSFKAATKAKCPIVPIALIDSFKPFDRSTTKPVTVQVHFLEPIPYEEYKDLHTNDIAKMVKERIEAVIAEYESR